MANESLREEARRFRLKAAECRALADQVKNPMAQESFRRMAESYDVLAERLEKQGKQEEKPEIG